MFLDYETHKACAPYVVPQEVEEESCDEPCAPNVVEDFVKSPALAAERRPRQSFRRPVPTYSAAICISRHLEATQSFQAPDKGRGQSSQSARISRCARAKTVAFHRHSSQSKAL